jgi:hypothetical protein
VNSHQKKQESWFLMSGGVKVIWDNDDGHLIETEMKAGLGYSVQAGQRRRIEGITESDIIDVSMPESGTTWQLQDDYARPDEAPEERKLERGE